jgi:pyruvate dehydrogenase E2 component (dihydrolipoamide acetyltransferase)
METDEGLFVPVLRDVGRRGADELRATLESLKGQVASRTVPREALVGATITLSNFGMHGGRFAELVVVPPQVAILGAGRAEPRIVVVAGAPAVRRVLPLSLSFDHRVVTGVEAARFLAAAIDDLHRP